MTDKDTWLSLQTQAEKLAEEAGAAGISWDQAHEARAAQAAAEAAWKNDRRIARNAARRARDQVRRDCGLVRGRDSLGRVIWE